MQTQEKLEFTRISRGFVISSFAPGLPKMRKLANLYRDQYNNKHVKVNGKYEPLTMSHKYLPID